MKKIAFISILSIAIWSCSKKVTPAASVNTTATSTVAVSKPVNEELVAGESTYKAKCGKCHDLPDASHYTSDRWVGLVNWMAPKARLSEDEKKNVLAYVQANSKH